jgi:hypothetical protein
MGVTVETIMGYLFNQVGEGRIRRSDILFSIDEQIREAVESAIEQTGGGPDKPLNATHQIVPSEWRIMKRLRSKGIDVDKDDLRIYLRLRDARVSLGDMYELIRDIELYLHERIKDVLTSGYGPREWWREGIPLKIRKDCQSLREEDREPAEDPYCYTNFIHLKEILEKNWKTLSKILSEELASDKKRLGNDLDTLNGIRNAVMHPVKMKGPTQKDFAFVREFAKKLGLPNASRRGRSIKLNPSEFNVDKIM